VGIDIALEVQSSSNREEEEGGRNGVDNGK
jgi:hypothetical protein